MPLAEDLSGPLLELVAPGPEVLLARLNRNSDLLGFDPVAPEEASMGTLEMAELSAEVRAFPLRFELGLPLGLSFDLSVPLARTKVEPFGSFDPSGASMTTGDALFEDPTGFFDGVSATRDSLRDQVESGQLTASEEERARQLLEQSGLFADELVRRVRNRELVPLAGTTAGGQLLGYYSGLETGFSDYGLTLPGLSLPDSAGAALLDAFPGAPLEGGARGWAPNELELGLRWSVHDGFASPADEAAGLQARTAVGVRVRLPLDLEGGARARSLVRPNLRLGLPQGDGQRDLELSLYQDLRWGGLLLQATGRYGFQQADRVTVGPAPPSRPFTPGDRNVAVKRDLGDYLRLRIAPRLVLNRFLSVGGEYRLWSKGRDEYVLAEENGDPSVLETETAQTLHRAGIGAFYRPDPPEEGERESAVPELGFIWQTAVAGSGGEVPAANLVTARVRIPIGVF